VVARQARAIGNQNYREINKLHILAASNVLRCMRDAGLFTQTDRGSVNSY